MKLLWLQHQVNDAEACGVTMMTIDRHVFRLLLEIAKAARKFQGLEKLYAKLEAM